MVGLLILLHPLIVFAGENEMLDFAKKLYEEKNYDDAQNAFKSFLIQYPESMQKSLAEAWDIKCDFRLGKYADFNERLETFRKIYPQHELLYELDYLKGMAFRRQAKWQESQEFFAEYLNRYPNSPYKKYAEEITGASQIALSKAYKAYEDGYYKKAYSLFNDFLTSNTQHTRKEEIEFKMLDCLYREKEYTPFWKSAQKIMENQKNHKHADDILHRMICVKIRLAAGSEARNLLEQLKQNYPHSKVMEDYDQLMMQSYLFGDNPKDLNNNKKDWGTIETLIPLCTEQLIRKNDMHLFRKYFSMANIYFSQVPDGRQKRLNYLKSLLSIQNLHNEDYVMVISESIMSLGENGLYDEAEQLAQVFFESETPIAFFYKDEVLKALVKIFVEKDGVEKGADIVRKYQKYFK